jgi:hypothetical protein
VKLLIIAASAATVGFGLFGQGAVNPAIKTHVSTLQNAKTFTATFSLTRVPAAPVDAKLVYSKPNFYKIETADKLIVCDGKMLRELNKADNTYTEVDASTAGSAEDEVATWAAFFNPDQFKKRSR